MDDPKDPRTAIAERIKSARIAAGYENAAAFARDVGVQANTIYRWESGLIVPDIFRLEAIARVCRVSADWLLRGVCPLQDREILRAWRDTRKGQTASEPAMAFLEALPLEGYTPSFAFYDLALVAFEHGLSPEDAARGSRFTESKKGRNEGL